MAYREKVLSNMCEKIETEFGRKKPLICEYSEYEKKKLEINRQLILKNQFTPKESPDSLNVLLKSLEFNEGGYEEVSSDDEYIDDLTYHKYTKEKGYVLI